MTPDAPFYKRESLDVTEAMHDSEWVKAADYRALAERVAELEQAYKSASTRAEEYRQERLDSAREWERKLADAQARATGLEKELIEAGQSYNRGYKQGLEDWHRCEQRHAHIDQLEQQHAALRERSMWPNIIAPPKHENPAEGWEDPKLPDFKRIWELAREVGYAVGIHGSLKRDVDLIAAPWTDEAVGNYALVEHLCAGLPATRIGGPEHKPHGRVAVTLQIDGYYKPIDLSIASRKQALATGAEGVTP